METTTYSNSNPSITLVEPTPVSAGDRDAAVRLPRGGEGRGFMEALLLLSALLALVFFFLPGLPAWAGGVFLIAPAAKIILTLRQALGADYQVDQSNDLMRHIDRELPE